ncbi:uncharacterized protein N7483_000694 [Penicillium malachiteum]|uniref:uncharacterized protein n=1 Tax=Penicillium malachiteum TaxID=1324776 RepID=UPI0025498D38|nr:uncharacterized protein N7483_000694 [Penicillium malachiteum]KAJ5735569.1 hypothetical protein N7483_000694 [Penicillium malachiteum]
MPLNLLYLPSEVIALIGWCLDSRRDIRALIETHPRFACQMQLWESYHCIEGNSFMHESGLLFACKTGNEIIARELMKDGACAWANSRFSRSWTDIVSYPLPIAARNGFCSIVKVLLKHSDPIIPHSEKFDFIMLQAIKAGSKETVEVLLSIKDDKIDPDFQLRRRKRHRYLGSVKPGCGPDTPLKTAMALANEEITRLLLDDGQFVFNMSSLGIAAAAGLDDLVKMILENPYPTRTAIADAARGGHMSTLKILVQDGRLDPNQPDKMGWAALHYAVYYGMMDMLQFLLGVECIRPDFRSDDRLGGNHTPFSEAAQHGDIKMMKILMRTRKVSAHYITWSSWTPLHHAAYAGSAKAVCFLLAQGVQIDQHDENFPSPFALAAAGGYLDVMRILHSTGKVDIESLGQEDRTPLSYAAGGGNPEAVAFLLAKGVNPDPKDSKGRTPPVICRPAVQQFCGEGFARNW